MYRIVLSLYTLKVSNLVNDQLPMTNHSVIVDVVVSVYQLVKSWHLPQFQNGLFEAHKRYPIISISEISFYTFLTQHLYDATSTG